MASRQLAKPASGSTAEICRFGGVGACRRRVEPFAPAGGVLGDRGADRKTGAGTARRAVSAAGRRLRRELRGLRVGQYRPTAEDPSANELGVAAGTEETHLACRPICRA